MIWWFLKIFRFLRIPWKVPEPKVLTISIYRDHYTKYVFDSQEAMEIALNRCTSTNQWGVPFPRGVGAVSPVEVRDLRSQLIDEWDIYANATWEDLGF